jgi:hypothetical protein
MKNFILIDGASSSINGIKYKAGEVVCSNHDLVAMWPTRFKPAPEGFASEKWDVRVNDVVGKAEYAVLTAHNNYFKVVDKKGKVVVGCKALSKKEAFAKYLELTGEEKPAKKSAPKPDEDEEDKDEEGDEDTGSDEEEGSDEEGDEDEEEEKPAKKVKKADKPLKKKGK